MAYRCKHCGQVVNSSTRPSLLHCPLSDSGYHFWLRFESAEEVQNKLLQQIIDNQREPSQEELSEKKKEQAYLNAVDYRYNRSEQFAKEKLGIISPRNVPESELSYYCVVIGGKIDRWSDLFNSFPFIWMFIHDLGRKPSYSFYLESIYFFLEDTRFTGMNDFLKVSRNVTGDKKTLCKAFLELIPVYSSITKEIALNAREEFIKAFVESDIGKFFQNEGYSREVFNNKRIDFLVGSKASNTWPEKYIEQLKCAMLKRDGMAKYHHVLRKVRLIRKAELYGCIAAVALVLMLIVRCVLS